MTHTSGPSEPKTINSAYRHQCRYVIRFKNNTNNDIFIVFTLQINRRASVTPHINFPGSYSATGITN